jgi:kynureninase
MAGAEGWQLSNPPILQMAALRASMEIFDEVGMEAIRAKSDKLTGFLESQLEGTRYNVLTPPLPARGSHLSLETGPGGKKLVEYLHEHGVYCDFREPGVLRVAPVALYNSFEDVARFAELLKGYGE